MSASSSSAGLGKPGHSPYARPSTTRPPSSSPFAPDWPRADHRLQACPATVPCATSVALLVSVDAGPPDVAASVCGEQSEFASGTVEPPPPPGPPKPDGNWPGGSCQMPWLAVIGTSWPAVQCPKPRLCSAETPGEVAFSSSEE